MPKDHDATEYFKKKILRDLEKDLAEERTYRDLIKAKQLSEKLHHQNNP